MTRVKLKFSHNILLRRRNILVHSKEVVRVIQTLHMSEAIIVRAVGGSNTIALVGGEEIDVDAASRERRRGIEVVARPTDAAFVIAGSSQRPWTFITNLASRWAYAAESGAGRVVAPPIAPKKISH